MAKIFSVKNVEYQTSNIERRTRGSKLDVPGHLAGGFTLMEVLIATAIFATVLVAINTVFFGALRLRATTSRVVEESIPQNHALAVLKSDLRSVLAPGGVIAGPLMGGVQSSLMSDPMMSQGGIDPLNALQICTTTGVTDDSSASLVNYIQPWPEVQKVTYYLRAPVYSTNRWGKELVRAVTRNLLATSEEMPAEQPLLDGVERIEFLFYDGTMWQDSWDSTTQQTAVQQSDAQAQETPTVPQAIKVLIEFAAVNRDERFRKVPLQLVVPIVTQARTNQVTSGGTSGQGQSKAGTSSPGQSSGGTASQGQSNRGTGSQGQNSSAGGGSSAAGGSRSSPPPTAPAPSTGSGGARGGGGRGGGQ